MQINFKALGAGLLSAGPLLVQFGGEKAAWWLGVIFTALGPILLSFSPPDEPKRKPRRRACSAPKANLKSKP
jgi:hypothetical protein